MMGYQLSCFVHQADQDAIEKRLGAFATQGKQTISPWARLLSGSLAGWQPIQVQGWRLSCCGGRPSLLA